MKLIILILSIMSMTYIMWVSYETGEIDFEKVLMLAVDMFYIVAIGAKLI